MIYNCPRTATVSSINYLTSATLNRDKYLQLLQTYPSIKKLFIKQIQKYRDPLKVFLELKLNRLSYFRKLPKHVKTEIVCNLKYKTYKENDLLYKIGQNCKTMHIIQQGTVEVL